ncbi:interleukin-11 isoform X1 [Paramormyrops kingsleyae]|uniref:Interleukin 11 n=1 Tax=Paramormyrops kingsleyae TaxID=1676925 RepID=A0A3B3R8X0_9TELE|nr:interleukin-11 isoform X1 [Paramormyrops kingsleyae]
MKLWTAFALKLAILLLLTPLSLSFPTPVHHRRTVDPEILTNQTRHLLKLTQDLLENHVIATDIEHRFKTLPTITSRATDLNSLEVKSTLAQLHADLLLYDLHFDWLNNATKKHENAALAKLGELIHLLKALIVSLQRQMSKPEVIRTPARSLPLPSIPVSQWEVVQSSLEILQKFRLYCDWTLRVLLSLKLKN